MNIKDIKSLHLFSEISHYIATGNRNGQEIEFKNLATGIPVNLSEAYVEKFVKTADQYEKVVKVGKEDKYWTEKQIAAALKSGEIKSEDKIKEGDLRQKGIRTLFEEIHSSQVFTVAFTKQSKALTKKELESRRNAQAEEAWSKIEAVQKSKKGVAEAAKQILKTMQEHPILPIEEGEERILRGYKLQFKSRDGRYDCFDVDLPETDSLKKVRPVNINTILWLVFDGTRYEVE